MVWALDYLGANPQCVIQHYEWRASFASRPGVTDGWNNGRLVERYGWHRCATVIDPIQPDGRLLSHHGLSVAERCRAVLPTDVKLEERTSVANRGVFRHWMTCDDWGEWVEERQRGTNFPDCEASSRLAEEWLEHFLAMPETFWSVIVLIANRRPTKTAPSTISGRAYAGGGRGHSSWCSCCTASQVSPIPASLTVHGCGPSPPGVPHLHGAPRYAPGGPAPHPTTARAAAAGAVVAEAAAEAAVVEARVRTNNCVGAHARAATRA